MVIDEAGNGITVRLTPQTAALPGAGTDEICLA
jgi:hypothetical protein